MKKSSKISQDVQRSTQIPLNDIYAKGQKRFIGIHTNLQRSAKISLDDSYTYKGTEKIYQDLYK